MASPYSDEDDDRRGFVRRHGFLLGSVGLVLVAGAVLVGRALTSSSGPAPRMPEVTMVRIVAPPAPPPPPPPPAPPKLVEEKMVEQMPVDSSEAKPDDSPPAPAADVGTSISGPGGPDGFGLGGNRGGGAVGGGSPRAGSGKWGWYAAQVQATISEALRKDPRTRDARFRLEVRVWPDASGRIVRAQFVGGGGGTAIEAVVRSEILTGLQLREPPPAGMPLPIVLRLTARRAD